MTALYLPEVETSHQSRMNRANILLSQNSCLQQIQPNMVMFTLAEKTMQPVSGYVGSLLLNNIQAHFL